MATRVFELARELGVTSKTVLTKCKAEGLDIKNHMTALTAGQEATVREWFAASEEGQGTAIETSEHIDLEKARAEASRQRRRAEAEDGIATEESGEDIEQEYAGAAAVEAAAEIAAELIDATVQEHAEPAPDAPVAEEPAEPAEDVAEEYAPQPEVAADQEPQAEEDQEPQDAAAVAARSPEAQSEEPQDEPEEAAKETREAIRPAGPMLVPRPARLKGPQIIRVEKPDFLPGPRTRRDDTGIRRGPGMQPGGESTQFRPTGRRGPGVGPTTETPAGPGGPAGGKKGKKRSPRRRSGRSADSGERLKEWRNQDLLERQERLAAAATGLRRHRPTVGGKRAMGGGGQSGAVEIAEPITLKDLSAASGIKAADMIRRMMQNGVLVTINQIIDRQTAEDLMSDFGIELQVQVAKSSEEELIERLGQREKGEFVVRAPVVTFLGHVDHGKTSLLDYIRKAQVAGGESGGITQHVGAYRYDDDEAGVHVVFLDTPGHEAFTAMRSRGAMMTDVVVLVVAADDGVMPQTVEAISHAKAAGVPIVVALNKIDVPNANIQRAMAQLADHDLQPREWGGQTEVIQTSAITGAGMAALVETLSLEAELLELRAEPDAPASGYVIEGQMTSQQGAIARLLIRDGTLRIGDTILAGGAYGRVRQITDDKGRTLPHAGPATPVEISGLDEVPEAGDRFYVVKELDDARTVAEDRRQHVRQQSLARVPKRTLKNLFDQIEAGEAGEVNVIVKADMAGSIEALVGSLEKLSTEEVRVNILHTGVGGVSTGDVTLADASRAIILGFHVVADPKARSLAEEKGVEIRLYRVIYDIIDDIRRVMEEGLEPELKEEVTGRAEVRQTFKISRLGTIAGCIVLDGTVNRNARVRVTRQNIVTADERSLDSLKRFKEDVREVRAGMECGLKLAGYDDIKEGDILEFYQTVKVARKL